MKIKSNNEIPTGTPLAALTWGQFKIALADAMAEVISRSRKEEDSDSSAWTASDVARNCRRRPSHVLSALKSGALPGNKFKNRWITSAGNVRAWVEKGCPV